MSSIGYSAVANAFFRSGEHRARPRRGSLPQAARRARRAQRARQIETWGRGIQRIFTACKEAGTPRPTLTFDGTGLTLEFRYAAEYLKAVAAAEQVTAPLTTPVAREVIGQVGAQEAQAEAQAGLTPTDKTLLTSCWEKPALGQELLKAAGYSERTGNFKRSLDKLMADGLLARTIPDKPTSPNQRYRLTAKGRAWLASHPT